jgi:hypothetical protein
MYRALLYLTGICLLATAPLCRAQILRVSEPRIELRDNTLHITYDILESDATDEFTVELVITDEDGQRIHAATLKGDVGDMVTGGNNKHIIWDLTTDRIELDAEIFVKIRVKAIPPAEHVVVPPFREESVQEPQNEPGVKEQPVEETTGSKRLGADTSPASSANKGLNRTGLVVQSFALPGLGLSRVTGKPHWIRGVAGYGCIAGSIILNNMAVNTYSGIMELSDYEAKDELYQESVTQDQVSEVLAYTAAAVWVTDIIWTLVGTSGLNRSAHSINKEGFSLHTAFEPAIAIPMIGIAYRF